MKRYVVGDIHGNYNALKQVLKKAKFDYSKDELIIIGDVVDGYNCSYEVVEELLKIKNKVFIIGNHDCVDEKTEALTKVGWKKYNEIDEGDLVYSFDDVNEKGVWSSINNIIVKDYEGDLIQLKGTQCDMLMTPNHRVFHKYVFKKRHPLCNINYGYELARNICGEYKIVVSASEKLSEYKITDDMLKIVGWVLTDGSILKKYGYIHLYQSKPKNVEHIRTLLEKCNLIFTEEIRNRQIRAINGRILKGNSLPEHTFRLNSVSSKIVPLLSKELPKWLFKLSDRQMKIFLEEVIRGDGTKNKSGNGATLYGSKQFLEQFQILCINKGYRAYLKKNTRGDFVLNITYKNTWCFNSSCKRKEYKFGTEHYKGKVWCLNVPLSNFMVRRNGKHYFTGNCWFMNHMATGWAENIWLMQGGEATRESYKSHGYHYKKMLKSHKDFFNNGVYWYELDNMLFVHGGFDYPLHPEDCKPYDLTWDRELIERMKHGLEIKEWKKIFVGHNSTEESGSEPIVVDWHDGKFAKLIQVDCGAGWGGRLCLYNIDTDKYFLSDYAKKLNPYDKGR